MPILRQDIELKETNISFSQRRSVAADAALLVLTIDGKQGYPATAVYPACWAELAGRKCGAADGGRTFAPNTIRS